MNLYAWGNTSAISMDILTSSVSCLVFVFSIFHQWFDSYKHCRPMLHTLQYRPNFTIKDSKLWCWYWMVMVLIRLTKTNLCFTIRDIDVSVCISKQCTHVCLHKSFILITSSAIGHCAVACVAEEDWVSTSDTLNGQIWYSTVTTANAE